MAFAGPKLPLAFERNSGQATTGAFLARGKGYSIAVSPDSISISGVPIRFVNANRASVGAGDEKLPGIVNYFNGSDPSKWTRNTVTYGKVRFQNVYPGIDVLYYGNQGHVEFDLVVAPNSDPGAILLDFEGAETLKIDFQGNLLAIVRGTELRIVAPVIYQEFGGSRKPVEGRFLLKSPRRVGFHVVDYDRRQPLVIDPTIVYSTVLGGSGYDYGANVAVDSSGNIYLTGTTSSLDFPVTAGAPQSTNPGDSIFITKLNPTATAVIYSTYLGGNGSNVASGIAVDSLGNAYVAGYTLSTNFPLANALQPASGGGLQGFVIKLNSSGTALLYSTYLGGPGVSFNYIYGLAVDAAGSAYLTGSTASPSFPITAGSYSGPLPGQSNNLFAFAVAFLCKLNPGGTALTYSSLIGQGEAHSVAIDSSGAAYITGYTTSPAFPVTGTGTLKGARDAFVTKMNPAGSALVYSTFLGGSGSENGASIAVDGSGQAYVTGDTDSPDFPITAGAAQTLFGGGSRDAFMVKLSATGLSLIYATYLGGRNDDYPAAIAVDASGNAAVAGTSASPNFPVFSALQSAMAGNSASLSSYNSSSQTWQAADIGLFGIAQSASVNAVSGSILIGTDSGSFRSVNNGATWLQTSTYNFGQIARAAASNSSVAGPHGNGRLSEYRRWSNLDRSNILGDLRASGNRYGCFPALHHLHLWL